MFKNKQQQQNSQGAHPRTRDTQDKDMERLLHVE